MANTAKLDKAIAVLENVVGEKSAHENLLKAVGGTDDAPCNAMLMRQTLASFTASGCKINIWTET